MNRQVRNQMAQETLAIIQRGDYTNRHGQRVELRAELAASVAGTRVVRPADWPGIIEEAAALCSDKKASVEVTGETTLAALERLIVSDGCRDVAALNFASAKNPGGGFLSGSQAQEESLARSSALYATLEPQRAYYDANRRLGSPVYTDHAIISPQVPVFRDDSGALLERPYLASFITMPAVNVGALPPGSPHLPRVADIMEHRMCCVLALAASTGQRALVLGAWGCGVFRNDPKMIAALFAKCLADDLPWRGCFDRIVFAVYDTTPDGRNREPFERQWRPE